MIARLPSRHSISIEGASPLWMKVQWTAESSGDERLRLIHVQMQHSLHPSCLSKLGNGARSSYNAPLTLTCTSHACPRSHTDLYQSSHSSFLAPGPAPAPDPIPVPPLAFLIALVPTALGRLFPASAKLSQKSFLLSSIGVLLYTPLGGPSLPSTNRLKPSAALFAPVCAPRATCAAVIRA